jgi:uncharacterized membrane protein YfbV (UPF0208 family)
MVAQLLILFATALLSSLFTCAGLWWLYQHRLRQALDEQLAVALEELDARLQTAIGTLGDTVEERVRTGVVKGVAAIPSHDVLADTTRTVAKTGAQLAERGLNVLLGRRNKPKD